MSRHSQIRISYTARGVARYEIEIFHDYFNKYQLIRGDEQNIVIQRANAKMAEWDEAWAKKSDREKHIQNIDEKKKLALDKTEEAQEILDSLSNLLKDAFQKDPTFNWENLKNWSDYPVPKPTRKDLSEPIHPKFDPEPERNWPKYEIKFGFLDNFSKSRRDNKEKEIDDLYKKEHSKWELDRAELRKKYDEQITQYHLDKEKQEREFMSSIEKWEQDNLAFIKKRDVSNAEIEDQKNLYLKGDSKTVVDYCDYVLSTSTYPDCIRTSYVINYNPDNKILLIDYSLPSPNAIPATKEVHYVQSTDKFIETSITELQLNKIYDQILYEITLRTTFELLKADTANALSSVVFNGYVKSLSASTGKEINPCVLSIQANKSEYLEINLGNVDPKACFKQLKGTGSSKLYSMTAVAPIMKIDRSDKRFITSYSVEGALNDAVNLALIDWEDFEHLVRELFEEEYGAR